MVLGARLSVSHVVLQQRLMLRLSHSVLNH